MNKLNFKKNKNLTDILKKIDTKKNNNNNNSNSIELNDFPKIMLKLPPTAHTTPSALQSQPKSGLVGCLKPLRQLQINLDDHKKIAAAKFKFSIQTQTIQLFVGRFSSTISFIKFENSSTRHVLFKELNLIYIECVKENFGKNFNISEPKVSTELTPLHLAKCIDDRLCCNGSFTRYPALVTEKAFNLILIEIIPTLVLIFGSDHLTPCGAQYFARVNSSWSLRIHPNHQEFLLPMIYVDRENWIPLSFLLECGILIYYQIEVICSNQNDLVVFKRGDEHTHKFASKVIDPRLLHHAAFSKQSVNSFINRAELYNYFLLNFSTTEKSQPVSTITNSHQEQQPQHQQANPSTSKVDFCPLYPPPAIPSRTSSLKSDQSETNQHETSNEFNSILYWQTQKQQLKENTERLINDIDATIAWLMQKDAQKI